MKSNELLDGLLGLFRENLPAADFFRAYPGKPGSRALFRPAVTGEVESETVKPGSEEVRLRFQIFLPEGTGAQDAENIFSGMCALAGKSYPGFSAISRGAAGRDRATGLLSVSCSLSILTQLGGGEAGQGRTVTLGGMEYLVSGVKTSVSRKGQELVSVGETEPFAVAGAAVEYTVELEGLEVSGLERLAVFTAKIGSDPGVVYTGCRWKSLSDALGRGVFVSGSRSGE